MVDRDETDTQGQILGVCGRRWVAQSYSYVEEGSRVKADSVSACIADLLDDRRATIRDAGVESAA